MIKIDRTKNGQFKKGTDAPNPRGRPVKLTLRKLISKEEEEELLRLYVKKAKHSDVVLVDLINRILK